MKTKDVISEKAWEVVLYQLDGGFLYAREYCYSENRNKAKSVLLNQIYGAVLLESGDDVNYLNIPIVRCKYLDKYHFEGDSLTLRQIEKLLISSEREQSFINMLADNTLKFCYIKKGGYYKPGSSGYTDFRHRAGVYTKEDAVSHARSCDDLTLVKINIEEHNTLIQEEIDDLTTRLL